MQTEDVRVSCIPDREDSFESFEVVMNELNKRLELQGLTGMRIRGPRFSPFFEVCIE